MPPRSHSDHPPPPSHPPPRHHGARHPREGRAPALDAAPIDAALAPLVPDARDRAFVLRCILAEGPHHHRGASWALLRMLVAVLDALDGALPEPIPSQPLLIRLPPNVEASPEDAVFPVGLPTRLLGSLLDDRELATALESLSDGPPHHALANALMALLVDAIHARVTAAKEGG